MYGFKGRFDDVDVLPSERTKTEASNFIVYILNKFDIQQKELAELSGIEKSLISKTNLGQRVLRFKELEAICNSTGINLTKAACVLGYPDYKNPDGYLGKDYMTDSEYIALYNAIKKPRCNVNESTEKLKVLGRKLEQKDWNEKVSDGETVDIVEYCKVDSVSNGPFIVRLREAFMKEFPNSNKLTVCEDGSVDISIGNGMFFRIEISPEEIAKIYADRIKEVFRGDGL